jgi:hypothetical protein
MTKINRDDLLLLDCLSDYWAPASFFGRTDIAEAFNKRNLVCNPEQNLKRFSWLIEKGLVVAKSRFRGLHIPLENELAASIRESATKPTQVRDGLFLGLTTLGGAIWEFHVRPNWNLLLSCAELRQGLMRIECAERSTLESLIRKLFPDAPLKINPTRPWQVTYWKYLPQGYRVTTPVHRLGENAQTFLRQKRAAWISSIEDAISSRTSDFN